MSVGKQLFMNAYMQKKHATKKTFFFLIYKCHTCIKMCLPYFCSKTLFIGGLHFSYTNLCWCISGGWNNMIWSVMLTSVFSRNLYNHFNAFMNHIRNRVIRLFFFFTSKWTVKSFMFPSYRYLNRILILHFFVLQGPEQSVFIFLSYNVWIYCFIFVIQEDKFIGACSMVYKKKDKYTLEVKVHSRNVVWFIQTQEYTAVEYTHYSKGSCILARTKDLLPISEIELH